MPEPEAAGGGSPSHGSQTGAGPTGTLGSVLASPNAAVPPVPGSVLFARYAFPPNLHGYCGPNEAETFYRLASAGAETAQLQALSSQFTGALPYLQAIADAHGLTPLDPDVVRAYWVGGPMLDAVPAEALQAAASPQLSPGGRLPADVAQCTAQHSFAVFFVYPWAALLKRGRAIEQALLVLDQCRIRTGEVTAVDGESATVTSRSLSTRDGRVFPGSPRSETVRWSREGRAMIETLRPGDLVSLHWEWVCDRIAATDAEAIEAHTAAHLEVLNGS